MRIATINNEKHCTLFTQTCQHKPQTTFMYIKRIKITLYKDGHQTFDPIMFL